MGELTEIGKFIFAEGHLAPLCSLLHSTKGTSRSLVIALRCRSFKLARTRADGSARRKLRRGGRPKDAKVAANSFFCCCRLPRSGQGHLQWSFLGGINCINSQAVRVWPLGVQIGKKRRVCPSLISVPSRSPGPFTLLCARCVFFNYMEWNFVQFHSCANMQQLLPISDNDSLNFK